MFSLKPGILYIPAKNQIADKPDCNTSQILPAMGSFPFYIQKYQMPFSRAIVSGMRILLYPPFFTSKEMNNEGNAEIDKQNAGKKPGNSIKRKFCWIIPAL